MKKILEKIPLDTIGQFFKDYWLYMAIGLGVLIVLLIVITVTRKMLGRVSKDKFEQIGEDDYAILTARIEKLAGKKNSFLFAGANLESLPITIPVNVAVQLAEDDYRCLLIDLDLRRDAIAKVFDIDDSPDPKHLKPRPRKTSVENLLIWPAHNFIRSKHMNIKTLVEAAGENYDIILINVPYLEASPDRTQIAAATDFSIIFSKTTTQAERLIDLMETVDSRIIGNIQIIDKQPQE
jgi:hypothetical protein